MWSINNQKDLAKKNLLLIDNCGTNQKYKCIAQLLSSGQYLGKSGSVQTKVFREPSIGSRVESTSTCENVFSSGVV